MQFDLNGKIAVVTGATQGIGYTIAASLLEAGAEVIINGRGEPKVAAAVARLQAKYPNAEVRGVAADVGSVEGCARIVAEVPYCDILVNNAAIFETADFFDVNDEVWDQYWAVNIMSCVRLSRAYLPGMRKRNWGRVVMISSECGISTPPDMLHYATTKTAMLGLSRGLAKTMAGTGVTVNAVLPGPTLSEGVEDMLKAETERTGKSIAEIGSEVLSTLRPSSITKRFQTSQEVANLVVYTCSPLSSGTTGAALRADGGVADTPI